MTVTGFKIEGLGNNDSVYICPNCAEEFSLEVDGRRTKEINSTQFRHGNGGGPCVFCGFDTLDILSEKAIRGKTEKTKVPHKESPQSLEPYADALDVLTDAYVSIQLAPGVEPERDEIVPGVTQVSHGDDAPETLVLEFERSNTEEEREEICQKVIDFLKQTPLETAYCPDYHNDGYGDAVLCVTDD